MGHVDYGRILGHVGPRAPLGPTRLDTAVGPTLRSRNALGASALVPNRRVPTHWSPAPACEGVTKLTMDLPALASAFLPNKPRTLVIGVLASR